MSTFYEVVSAILAAGVWTNYGGTAPVIKNKKSNNWATMKNRGLLIESATAIPLLLADSSELFSTLIGMIECRETTQAELDKIEADIKAIFKADNTLKGYTYLNLVPEELEDTNFFEVIIEMEVLN